MVPLDDLAGLELVQGWREQVWRNAERLLNAKNRAEWKRSRSRSRITRPINARLIAAGGMPGYADTRDAYCAAGPSGS